MLEIKDNEVSLTRGDTAYLDVKIFNANKKPYQPHEGDQVVLSVKRNATDKDFAFVKKFKVNETIKIEPRDTEKLRTGRYYYDVQLTTSLGEIFTVIDKNIFCIEEEISK